MGLAPQKFSKLKSKRKKKKNKSEQNIKNTVKDVTDVSLGHPTEKKEDRAREICQIITTTVSQINGRHKTRPRGSENVGKMPTRQPGELMETGTLNPRSSARTSHFFTATSQPKPADSSTADPRLHGSGWAWATALEKARVEAVRNLIAAIVWLI